MMNTKATSIAAELQNRYIDDAQASAILGILSATKRVQQQDRSHRVLPLLPLRLRNRDHVEGQLPPRTRLPHEGLHLPWIEARR